MNLSLQQIAHALGGRVSGGQVLAPGPGHNARDRSLSVKPDPHAPDGFLIHSFAGDDPILCKDHVRARLELPPFKAIRERAPRAASRSANDPFAGDKAELEHARRQLGKARWLWQHRDPIEGSPAETYLRKDRCYRGAFPPTLGFLPARKPEHHPALIAAFGLATETCDDLSLTADELHGVHLTLLAAEGKKADLETVKLMVGPSSGWPIVIASPSDLLGLAITEGIEDALSVRQATGLGAWAAGSAGRMPALGALVPRYIETVTVYAHPDHAGKRGARDLADALLDRGIEVFMEGLP